MSQGRHVSAFGASCSALLIPDERQGFTQGFELKCRRLAAVEDYLDDVGGEQRQAQHVADIGGVDLLLRGISLMVP